MAGEPRVEQVAIALEHMTGLSRGALTWLNASTLDVALDDGCLIEIRETPGDRPERDVVARLHRAGAGYEIEAMPGSKVWVNGAPVSASVLRHGDTVEFGETGPLCRLRVYSSRNPLRNSVPDILSDVAAYLRVSRQRPLRRGLRAGRALLARLTFETSLLFRVVVLLSLAGLGLFVYQQRQLNTLLQRQIESAAAQLDDVATALVNTRRESLRPADLGALRDEFEQRMTSNVSRLEKLELRSTATGRVIAETGNSVAFLQGMYGFRERGSGRMLRQVVTAEGVPLMTFRGRPLLSLDGAGPVVELPFTGTGFLSAEEGILITNRHVALPWEQAGGLESPEMSLVEAVMLRFIAYLPGQTDARAVSLLVASETADLALLRLEGEASSAPGLRLAATPAATGDEVIVMGYPTGLRSMLAQSGADFIAALQDRDDTGFWSVAARLAEAGFIAPLSSRGIVGQVTGTAVVYDADTTHGGSGGPVLDLDGNVIAVNSAILPEYGGSNLGVPAAQVRALLDTMRSQ